MFCYSSIIEYRDIDHLIHMQHFIDLLSVSENVVEMTPYPKTFEFIFNIISFDYTIIALISTHK